jgi:hypothetical protein
MVPTGGTNLNKNMNANVTAKCTYFMLKPFASDIIIASLKNEINNKVTAKLFADAISHSENSVHNTKIIAFITF